MAASLDDLSKGKNSTFRFQPVDKAEQQQFGKQGKSLVSSSHSGSS